MIYADLQDNGSVGLVVYTHSYSLILRLSLFVTLT